MAAEMDVLPIVLGAAVHAMGHAVDRVAAADVVEAAGQVVMVVAKTVQAAAGVAAECVGAAAIAAAAAAVAAVAQAAAVAVAAVAAAVVTITVAAVVEAALIVAAVVLAAQAVFQAAVAAVMDVEVIVLEIVVMAVVAAVVAIVAVQGVQTVPEAAAAAAAALDRVIRHVQRAVQPHVLKTAIQLVIVPARLNALVRHQEQRAKNIINKEKRKRKMKKSIVIIVNEETVNYLQRLHFDVEARKGVIDTLVSNHKDDKSVFEGAAFRFYSQELAEVTAEYDLAKEEMAKKYIPDALQEHQINWNLDFREKKLTIDILCDCGVKAIAGE